MYYQVVYTDFRSKKRTYSAMIHRSNTVAKKELDWEPHIKLEEGLKEAIAYFKSVI